MTLKSILSRWLHRTMSPKPVNPKRGGRPKPSERRRWQIERLEDRVVPATIVFQQGFVPTDITNTPIPGATTYLGTNDTEISSNPSKLSTPYAASAISISIDGQDGGAQLQGLLGFFDIFGTGAGKVPLGSKINSATLTIRSVDGTNKTAFVSFSRMLVPWEQSTATWQFFSSTAGGLQTDDVEMSSVVDAVLPFDKLAANVTTDFDVTNTVQAWATGVPNFGWGIYQFGGNGWDFATSEFDIDPGFRPKLTIDFDPPSGAGEFRIAQSSYFVSEGNTGTKTVSIEIYRVGGDTGEAKVNLGLAASPGTATNGTDFLFTPATITFPAGVRTQTVSFQIVGDTTIEGHETINFELSNPTGGATISPTGKSAVFTIGDNDALINEVFFDPVGTDTALVGYEFAELIGTPGASLGGIGGKNLYFISIDGDAGTEYGLVDISVDLSSATFGSNGLLLLRPPTFKYDTQVPAATNQISFGPIDSKNTFENPTVSYLLVLSDAPIPIGTQLDLDGDGTINFPPGINAVVIDQIGTTDGGGTDLVVGAQAPGIRLIQGTGQMDAVTRFNSTTGNDLTPLSIAAWYGGDINDNDSLAYNNPNDPATLGKATPNTPPGALVTPGDLNIPRAFAFASTKLTISETIGTLVLTVNRLGDTSGKASVEFFTSNGSAVAGQDFVAASGKLEFAAGESSKTISITIENDNLPEGFENFFVNLHNPSSPFQISTKQARIIIQDDDSLVATFQDGVNGYSGTRDVGLFSWGPTDTFGSDLLFSVDASDQNLPTQGLIRFEDVFGSGTGQVPAGSKIYGGILTFFVTSRSEATANIRFYEMLQNWEEATATWANPNPTITNGITPDDVEARSKSDFSVTDPQVVEYVDLFIPGDTLQTWANGAPNYGWMMNSDSTDGWDFLTREVTNPLLRPKLTVIYTEPSGKGDFRMERPSYSVGEGAGTFTFNISRIGGTTGTASVSYKMAGVTATAASDFTAASGTVTFPDGVVSLPVTVTIINDNIREANETFEITLFDPSTGSNIIAGGGTTVVTIRDNETPTGLLLNEININPPDTDQPFEYVELIGPAGVGLGNIYILTIEGDGGGTPSTAGKSVFRGVADVVFDLSTGLNGSSGLSIVTSTTNDLGVPSGTTRFTSKLLDVGTLQTLENGTNSFLLVWSPDATITQDGFDFDWNNNGVLELPAGAVILDAVSVSQENLDDLVYPGAANTVLISGVVPDALTRIVGDTTATDAKAWYGGDLAGTASSSRFYDAAKSTASLPAGAVITPGLPNYVANTAPVITSNGGGATASITHPALTKLVTTVTFNDPDVGQPFAFSLSGPDAALFAIAPDGKLSFLAAPDPTNPVDANTDGVYEVTVAISDGLASDSQDLTISIGSAVTGIVVNNGDPQRSRLLSITLNFAGPVNASLLSGLGAVKLTRTAATPSGSVGTVVQTGATGANGRINLAPASGEVTSLTLTFDNANGAPVTAGVENTSLADGRWQLSIPTAAYTSPLNDSNLRRLFGDSNADGIVDSNDFAAFGAVFGASSVVFDFDNNGSIDTTDFAEFGNRFGISL